MLRVEGGYSNNSSDPGGETKYGISKRSFPNLDIPNLTREQAIEIYKSHYWDRANCDSLPWPMSLLVFDSAVNSGVGLATEWLRRYPDFRSYLSARLRFYTSLGTWPTFGKGWTNRMAALLEAAGEQPGTVDAVVLNYPLLQRLLHAIRGRIDRATWRIRPMSSQPGLKLDLATAQEEGDDS